MHFRFLVHISSTIIIAFHKWILMRVKCPNMHMVHTAPQDYDYSGTFCIIPFSLPVVCSVEAGLVSPSWCRCMVLSVRKRIHHTLSPCECVFKTYMSSLIPLPYILILNLTFCAYYSGWMSCMISFVWSVPSWGQRQASETFKMKICASTGNWTSDLSLSSMLPLTIRLR